jgi:4-amino-4-deoxy-L-arabinose transferase-like glycosyltransferase
MEGRQASGVLGKWGAWLGLVALLLCAGRIAAARLDEVVYQPGSDDGYYLRYLREVVEGGLGALPGQFRFYLGDQRHWIFPPPSRIGFTLVSALFARVDGVRLETLSHLSVASFLALVAVQFVFARRWFGDLKALLVAALTAFSPLYLGLSRLALTDSFVSLTQVASIWLFVEYVRAPQRLRWTLAFGLAFTFAILTKEISGLLALPFGLYALVERVLRKREVPLARTIAMLCVPALVSLVLWAVAAGNPATLLRVMKIVLLSPASNEYALAYGSGGWYRYPIDELLMSPWPTALGLAGVVVALWRWSKGEYDSLAVALALVYVAQVGVLSFFTKNLRYVAVLEMPLRILAVVLLWEVLRARSSTIGRWACVACVALLCWLGHRDYELIWLRWKTYDPVTLPLAGARGLVPWQLQEPGR